MTDAEKIEDLYRQLNESDAIRSALVSASSDLSKDICRVIAECQMLQGVVDAAVEWRRSFDASGRERPDYFHRAAKLRDLVDAHLARTRSRS